MTSSARSLYSKKKKNSFSDTLEILVLPCLRIPYYFRFLSNFVCFWLPMVFSYISYCSCPILSTLSKEQGNNRIMGVATFLLIKMAYGQSFSTSATFFFLILSKACSLFLLGELYWLAYWTEWRIQKNLSMYGYIICESDESSSMEKRLFFSVRGVGSIGYPWRKKILILPPNCTLACAYLWAHTHTYKLIIPDLNV